MNFVRIYPFHVSGAADSWYFHVEVKCHKTLNRKTGMSVDLVSLDQIAAQMFSPEICSQKNIVQFLQKKTEQLRERLSKQKTKLISTQYNEIRNSSIRFEKGKILFIRKEFARNPERDLFQITSVFAGAKRLQEIEMHNLKTDVVERHIF